MAQIKTILHVSSSGLESGGYFQYKGLWSNATALPTTAKTGWVYKFSIDCVVPYLSGDVTFSAGTMAVALASNSGSAADWDQL